MRSKELATVLAAQDARTDARILALENAHATQLEAMNASHALAAQTALQQVKEIFQQSMWGGGRSGNI